VTFTSVRESFQGSDLLYQTKFEITNINKSQNFKLFILFIYSIRINIKKQPVNQTYFINLIIIYLLNLQLLPPI
jgi:hypothetical protein